MNTGDRIICISNKKESQYLHFCDIGLEINKEYTFICYCGAEHGYSFASYLRVKELDGFFPSEYFLTIKKFRNLKLKKLNNV